MRTEIRIIEKQIRELFHHAELKGGGDHVGQIREIRSNVVLSFRHLEDSRMRLGKVIQQIEGGVSIYDKEEEPEKEKPDGTASEPKIE